MNLLFVDLPDLRTPQGLKEFRSVLPAIECFQILRKNVEDLFLFSYMYRDVCGRNKSSNTLYYERVDSSQINIFSMS